MSSGRERHGLGMYGECLPIMHEAGDGDAGYGLVDPIATYSYWAIPLEAMVLLPIQLYLVYDNLR
jgi:hypothetical protein